MTTRDDDPPADPPTISVSSRPGDSARADRRKPAGAPGAARRPARPPARPATAGGPGRSRGRPVPPSAGPRPDGPGVLIRPVDSARPGTMPAGLVLMVMAVGLFVAMVLNAPATLRKSNGKVDNPAWRTDVAEGVNAVSSFFFLDEPRIALDRALGKNQTTDQAIEEVVAEAEADRPDEGPVTPEATPVLRTPTTAEPLRIYIAGDSMAGGLADTFVATSQGTGLVLAEDGHRVSSGLSRPDFFNWPQFLSQEIDPQNGWDPDVLVIGFGANDLQNIPLDGGGLVLGTQAWLDEYRARVAGTMDIVRSGDDDRVTLWMGLPPMGPRSGIPADVVDQVNAIYRSEAEGRPWIVYVDTWSYLANPDGSYAEQLAMASGEVRRVRAGDDIHFDVAGSQRLTWAIMGHIGAWADLSAAGEAVVPPPGQAAPPEVTERTELPDPGPRG